MNIYTAIMKAADHIEANPDDYDFGKNGYPCGTPACMAGWVGHFAGIARTHGSYVNRVREHGVDWLDIVQVGYDHGFIECRDNPYEAAAALRLYADKYHKPKDAIPAKVRAIFEGVKA